MRRVTLARTEASVPVDTTICDGSIVICNPLALDEYHNLLLKGLMAVNQRSYKQVDHFSSSPPHS